MDMEFWIQRYTVHGMKTNRDLRIEYPNFTRAFYDVPAGTRVIKIERGRHTPDGYRPRYDVADLRAVGVICPHDIKYHSMTVPDDAVDA